MKKVYYNWTCIIMKRPKPDLVNVILIKRSLIGNEKKIHDSVDEDTNQR